MFTDDGLFVPSFLPEEDLAALEKMRRGRLAERYGIGDQVALLVVDMTRGFVEDEYPTGWAATGIPCAEAIETLLEEVRRHDIPVFFTRPVRMKTNTELGRWSKTGHLTGEVPDKSPRANEFYDGMEPRDGEIVIDKQKPSAFYGTPLHAMLTYERVDTVIVTGMVTSGCIRATVNDSFAGNFRTIVPLECVADRSQMSHEVELFDMGTKYADVVPLSDVLEQVRAYAEGKQPAVVPARKP